MTKDAPGNNISSAGNGDEGNVSPNKAALLARRLFRVGAHFRREVGMVQWRSLLHEWRESQSWFGRDQFCGAVKQQIGWTQLPRFSRRHTHQNSRSAALSLC